MSCLALVDELLNGFVPRLTSLSLRRSRLPMTDSVNRDELGVVSLVTDPRE